MNTKREDEALADALADALFELTCAEAEVSRIGAAFNTNGVNQHKLGS